MAVVKGQDDRISGESRQRSVVLTGFMATGKSTVGRHVAARLRYGFVDTDRLIEERFGPISEIFDTQGEAAFRVMERDLASELAPLPALVIATGGGMLVDDAVAEVFRGAGSLIISLVADVDTIYRRVGGERAGERRPMLAVEHPRDRIAELVAERTPAYAKFPQVRTDTQSSIKIVDEIVGLLHST
jgi:shikimate kinase